LMTDDTIDYIIVYISNWGHYSIVMYFVYGVVFGIIHTNV
jgi:hypothetical protein